MPTSPVAPIPPRPAARGRRRGALALLIMLIAPAAAGAATVEGPADPLFHLVPPDASAVLAVEDLRARIRQVEAWPLAADLGKSPLVAATLASDRAGRFRRAMAGVEAALGVPIRAVVDDILGDAVVLALKADPRDPVDRSSGLLLIRPRQRKFLEQLLDGRNRAQARRGRLAEVVAKPRGTTTYQSRRFRPGQGAGDYYAFLDDGTFAWSNSESMLGEVIDRRAGGRPGWDSSPGFARLRAGLPGQALASLHVAPGFAARVLDLTKGGPLAPPHYARKVVASYLEAVAAIGFALEWRDGPVLHAHDVLDPARVPPWLAAWIRLPMRPAPLLDRVPPTALGVVAARFDFGAALRAGRSLVEESDRATWEAAEQVATGLLGGRPADEFLDKVDPHVVLALTPRAAPDSWRWFGVAGGATWRDPGEADAAWPAVDNAVRTGMAIRALWWSSEGRPARVATRPVAGRPVTTLGPPDRPILAAQVGPDRLLVADDPAALAQFGAAGGSPAGSTWEELRAKHAADCDTFAVFDLLRVVDTVGRSRPAIVAELAARTSRPAAEVERDLDQVLALARLFRGVVLTARVGPDSTEIHRTIGLIAR